MKDELLKERERILKELESVENLLIRHGWKRKTIHPSAPIEYSKEFREWVASLDDPDFTLADFRAHLVSKHGNAEINPNSLRTPFKTEEALGTIKTIKRGKGRKPAVYGRCFSFSATYPHLTMGDQFLDY